MFLSTLESAFMSSTPDTRLIWIDLEMTGLDTDNDKIIEIATIVTDEATGLKSALIKGRFTNSCMNFKN